MKLIKYFVIFLFVISLNSCGYKSGSLLQNDLKSIYINNFFNKIDISKEVSDKRSNYSYYPGLEVEITKEVINRFIFDGSLSVRSENHSDLILRGALVDYKKFPLSYVDDDDDENDDDRKEDDVEELRIEIVVELELYDRNKQELLWKESSFRGQSSYSLVGPNKRTETECIKEAVKDLAERIIERTVEAW